MVCRISASYELFDKLECRSEDLNGDFSDDGALALVEEDKMRCHIMNCLAALSVVQIQRKRIQKTSDNNNNEMHELVKMKVFGAACSMMIATEFDNDEVGNKVAHIVKPSNEQNLDRLLAEVCGI